MFTDAKTQDWLDRQLARCRNDGFGLWAVELKETDQMIGQMGSPWRTRACWKSGTCSTAPIGTMAMRRKLPLPAAVLAAGGSAVDERITANYADKRTPHAVYARNPEGNILQPQSLPSPFDTLFRKLQPPVAEFQSRIDGMQPGNTVCFSCNVVKKTLK